ncbi:hypothetical protein KIK06_01490 [Nocardiopsis sp. EMB25]|uniref:hypothetical protein n=1 Tax=Nocardiopsis sp. EMB25 TaxID=2835867 RepID=UPI0022837F5D|nr:hypothetical protein [Nocardiopsis sp. EMB25]MCY9782561.1 hypothetical protein [Nocardiopsis sp. EMB25]
MSSSATWSSRSQYAATSSTDATRLAEGLGSGAVADTAGAGGQAPSGTGEIAVLSRLGGSGTNTNVSTAANVAVARDQSWPARVRCRLR